MTIKSLLLGFALAGAFSAAASAATIVVPVDSHSGPWSVTANPTLDYGATDFGPIGAPTSVAVAAGDNLTVTYVSGLTSAFDEADPNVDGVGYDYLTFGSGPGLSDGVGFFARFPSYYIDPTNTGPAIYLSALVGAFADASGAVLGAPFAVRDGPLSVTAPAGATQLLLGINDDNFADNSGSLSIRVDGVSAAPEPGTWALMIAGAGMTGVAIRRRRRTAPALA